MPASEVTGLLEAFARMRLQDLELRYQHQRLRTRLELLLECPLGDLAGPMPTLAEPPEARTAVPSPLAD
jgi:hypothetical protein